MSFNLGDYKFDFSGDSVLGDSGMGDSSAGVAPASSSGGIFSSVNDVFKTLGSAYITGLALKNANPAGYSNYAWGAASGQTNGAILQPYNQVVAQQQQAANQAAAVRGNNQMLFFGVAGAVVLFLLLRK